MFSQRVTIRIICASAADPDLGSGSVCRGKKMPLKRIVHANVPDPDPYIFWPPGYGFGIYLYKDPSINKQK